MIIGNYKIHFILQVMNHRIMKELLMRINHLRTLHHHVDLHEYVDLLTVMHFSLIQT